MKMDVGEKWVKHYSSNHQILLVGDGDFSFSLSLARSFGHAFNIVATSLDPYDVVIKKYKEAKSNLESLEKLGASLLHGVDATMMKCRTELTMRKFDRIIFNFPHAGFRGKEDDYFVIHLHRSLVHGFFWNASSMLRPGGEIHINHKTTAPFCYWDIETLASWNSLELIELVKFKLNDYPGYKHKRGDGSRCDEPFPLGQCSTFKFWLCPTTNKMPGRREQWHAYVASFPVHELRFGLDTDMPLNHGNGMHMLPEFSQRTCYNVGFHVNEYKYGGFNRDMMIMNSERTLNQDVHVLPQCNESDWYGGGYFVNEPRFGYMHAHVYSFVASLPVHELRFGFNTDMPLNHGNGTHMLPEFSQRTCYNVGFHVNEYKYGGFNRDMMIMNSERTLNQYVHVLPQCNESDWYGGGYSVNEPRFGYNGDMVSVHPQRNLNPELGRTKALSLVRQFGNQEDTFWKN